MGRPEDQWEEEGGENSYAVKITIPEDSKTAEFYYFCHIHSGMSGLMVVEAPAPDANKLVTPLAADYYGAPPQEFDVACGTYDNVTAFHENFDTFCPDMTFLCDPPEVTSPVHGGHRLQDELRDESAGERSEQARGFHGADDSPPLERHIDVQDRAQACHGCGRF